LRWFRKRGRIRLRKWPGEKCKKKLI
jgi:hypothetical protein